LRANCFLDIIVDIAPLQNETITSGDACADDVPYPAIMAAPTWRRPTTRSFFQPENGTRFFANKNAPERTPSCVTT